MDKKKVVFYDRYWATDNFYVDDFYPEYYYPNFLERFYYRYSSMNSSYWLYTERIVKPCNEMLEYENE